ncbi:hypothetical protein [Halomarina oriensis]|uniref:Uncharacterized protein n=1 Tax=Halomarina oriensis TaxID=671145 RepID=A0A6B0GM04_9EURY|nr:hypothetical protein [Halomarina oriensis]MWG35680.1 hypothetical protein [Halomarina oriensis]
MRRREALFRVGTALTPPVAGVLAGCQRTSGADPAPAVTPAAVPTDAAVDSESRAPRRRTVVRSLYAPTIDRVRRMDRIEHTTVGYGDDTDRHTLTVLNESATRWNLTLRLRREGTAGTLLLVDLTLPPRTYRVYELTPAARYRVRVESDAGGALDDALADEFSVGADWFERDHAVTVAGITLDGYWSGTLLNRALAEEFAAE